MNTTFSSIVLPKTIFTSKLNNNNNDKKQSKILATSGAQKYDLMYYLKGALAGGICCSITHGALCPVDVVKTRIQLDPVTFNKGLIGGFSQIIEAEGLGGLLTGLGPTVVGYFIQGIFILALLIMYAMQSLIMHNNLRYLFINS